MLMKSTEPDFNFIKIVNEAKEKRQSQAGSHCRLGSGVDPEASRSEGSERSACVRGERAREEPRISARLHFPARGRSTWICSEGKWTFRSSSQEKSLD